MYLSHTLVHGHFNNDGQPCKDLARLDGYTSKNPFKETYFNRKKSFLHHKKKLESFGFNVVEIYR